MEEALASILECCICNKVSHAVSLLDCLHSCCEGCLSGSSCVGDTQVTCPKCQDVTRLTSRDWYRMTATQCRAPSLSLGSADCAICITKGYEGRAAEQWCKECSKALCDECARDHTRHVASHTIVSLFDTLSSTTSNQLCKIHGDKLGFHCLQCKAVMCLACREECMHSHHDIQYVGGERMNDLVQDATNRVLSLLELLESSTARVTSAMKLPDVQAVRKSSVEALQKNKRAVLDELDRAYVAAEDELHRVCDKLSERAYAATMAAELLQAKVQQAIAYSRHLLGRDNMGSLLQKQQLLLARLQSLVDDVNSMPATIDPKKCISIRHALPESCHETCRLWIGSPQCSDIIQAEDSAVTPTDQCQIDVGHSSIGLHERQDGAEGSGMKLEVASHFAAPAECYDMAVTAAGHLLLAAGGQGLKEYDASGRELSSWTPARTAQGREDCVCTVDELQDGRVAVGLTGARTVLLLSHRPAAGDAWLEAQRVTKLRRPPWRLSVHGELVAVAEQESTGGAAGPGKHLVLVSLLVFTSRRELLRKELDYEVQCVAAMQHAVLTASWEKVKLSDGIERYIVDSYSHAGQQLWRQSWAEQVWDICATPSSAVLYLALNDGDRVATIRAEDGGQLLPDVICGSSSPELKSPRWLSLSRGRCTVLAVLASDRKTVTFTLYPLQGSAGSK